MTLWGFPDWKKIGWHVGKRLKDILNPTPEDLGEGKDQREAQRLRDALKGFVYFDDFDDLLLWSLQDVDPIQRANTPLLDRPAAGQNHPEGGVKILLCHDYSGGFHDYESIRPSAMKCDMYTCNYLQYIDLFIYFSHKLVCIPPPTWTNSMHRNGVRILGTFILEPQTSHVDQLLRQVDGEFVIARRLAILASVFGFDGWLLNFEKEIPVQNQELVATLKEFISQLRRLMGPKGRVIWYDALDCDNEVKYQNSLTSKNLDFARSADSLFTNYKWTREKIQEASKFAAQSNIIPSHVYFGIDVWAQNTNMPGPPRITFPPKGGGGTNTGLAVEQISQKGFSAAIFAPAWPYEHFSTALPIGSSTFSQISAAEAVNKSMWEGTTLPEHLECDCLKGRPHHVADYRLHYITKYAQDYPAGSSIFFHTDFQRAFRRSVCASHNMLYSTLGSQNVLPQLLPVSAPLWEDMSQMPPVGVIYGELEYDTRPYLKIMTKMLGTPLEDVNDRMYQSQHSQGTQITSLRLFKLNMPANGSLVGSIEYECHQDSQAIIKGFFVALEFDKRNGLKYEYYPVAIAQHEKPCTLKFNIQSNTSNARLVEIGAYCARQIMNHQALTLIKIFSITIKRKTAARDNPTVVDIHIIERGKLPNQEKRLVWNWQGSEEASGSGVPWSPTTGPFSHFIVGINGRAAGVAHCLEFPLREEDYCLLGKKQTQIEIHIQGVLFDGSRCDSASRMIFTDEGAG